MARRRDPGAAKRWSGRLRCCGRSRRAARAGHDHQEDARRRGRHLGTRAHAATVVGRAGQVDGRRDARSPRSAAGHPTFPADRRSCQRFTTIRCARMEPFARQWPLTGGLPHYAASGRCGRSSSGSSRGCGNPRPSRHRCRHPTASARAFRSGCRRRPRRRLCSFFSSTFLAVMEPSASDRPLTSTNEPTAIVPSSALTSVAAVTCTVMTLTTQSPMNPAVAGEALDRAVELGFAEAVVLGGLGDVDLGGRDRTAMSANVMRRSNPLTLHESCGVSTPT